MSKEFEVLDGLQPSSFNMTKFYEHQSNFGDNPNYVGPELYDWEEYAVRNGRLKQTLPPESMNMIRLKSI